MKVIKMEWSKEGEETMKKCEICLQYGLSEGEAGNATGKVWMERPFDEATDRYVHVCAQCHQAMKETKETA